MRQQGESDLGNNLGIALSLAALFASEGTIVTLCGKTLVTKIQRKNQRWVFLSWLYNVAIDIVQIVKWSWNS